MLKSYSYAIDNSLKTILRISVAAFGRAL